MLSAGLIGLAVSCSGPHTGAGASRSMPQDESKPDAGNVYELAGKNDLSRSVAGQRWLVYVPNHTGNTVTVIDPGTYRVIDTYPVGAGPQHVVPSYDLQTLWVNNNSGNSLTLIDPKTGTRAGPDVPVADPYNMYFTPDGKSAIVVAEAEQRLDFRDPHTMALQNSTRVDCPGVNHADFAADLTHAVFTCEFSGNSPRLTCDRGGSSDTCRCPVGR